MSSGSDIAEVMTRLSRLEKENRRLKRTAAAVGVAVLGVLLTAFGQQEQSRPARGNVVEAERFVVRDQSGKERAVLGLRRGEPGLLLNDENGKTRLLVRAAKGGPNIVFYDENTTPRAVVSVDADGAALFLTAKDGKRSTAVVTGPASSGIGMVDAKGRVRVELELAENGPGLRLLQENGKPFFAQP